MQQIASLPNVGPLGAVTTVSLAVSISPRHGTSRDSGFQQLRCVFALTASLDTSCTSFRLGLLLVSVTASDQSEAGERLRGYRRLARQWHPDKRAACSLGSLGGASVRIGYESLQRSLGLSPSWDSMQRTNPSPSWTEGRREGDGNRCFCLLAGAARLLLRSSSSQVSVHRPLV